MNNIAEATLKYALSSDKKLNLIAKLVNGKNVDEALNILDFTAKKTAKILANVVKSALANAIGKGHKPENMYIKEINIGRGPKLKRIRFASRSRVNNYIRHRAFVKVVLDTK